MRKSAGILLLLCTVGCWSRPCGVGLDVPAPCKARGDDTESWRIATLVCRKLESAGTSAEQAFVDGSQLTLSFPDKFGRSLLVDREALQDTTAEFMSLMRRESGTVDVTVELVSGKTPIAIGETMESGEDRIRILE